jgi:hypothetical protein
MGGPLDRLKIKRMAKPQPIFKIQLKRGIVGKKMEPKEVPAYVDNDIPEDVEVEEVVIRKLAVDVNDNPIKERVAIVFADKRRDVDVNRALILTRLNKYTNIRVVEKKRLTKDSGQGAESLQLLTSKATLSLRSEEKFETDKTQSFKVPLLNGNNYGENPVEDSIHFKRPKKTITIAEKIAEADDVPMDNDEKELEQIEEVAKEVEEEVEKEAEKETDIVVFKPKKGRPKAKRNSPKEEGEEEKEQDKKADKAEKARQTRKTYEEFEFGKEVKVGKKLLVNRLPKREKFTVKTSNFYMNNRKLYVQKIAELFRPYRKEVLDKSSDVSCDTLNTVDFKLLTHQKVAREYLNLYTPYRGLLLFYSLGSGKSCTSIAIAESMKTQRPIVVMTPASLKMNFFSELKKCGDLMYRKNQYWEFISVTGNPDYVPILSKVLQIPEETIQRNKGAWLVDITKKESNFGDLKTEQQEAVDEQLNLMIRAKYIDINYNGLNRRKLAEMTEDYTKNIFDNATVIIDEAHNFVSRIVNKIKQPKSISYILYDQLMKANNTKIVLLTGTPIINYPNELGILFNILRGYIKKWTFQLRVKASAPAGFKVNKDTIMQIFDRQDFNTYDYVEYSGNNLTITRNPYGFINMEKDGKKDGKKTEKMIKVKKGGTTQRHKKTDKKHHTRKNKSKNSDILEPKFLIDKDHDVVKENPNYNDNLLVVEPEASIEYNDRVYHDLHKGGQRSEASGQGSKGAQLPSSKVASLPENFGGGMENYDGVTLDESGNISDEDFIKEVRRILTQNHLEIVESGSSYEELKALPDDSESFLSTFVDQDTVKMKNENAFKKRILGLTSYFRSAEEKLLPSFVKTEGGSNYHIVPVEMSEFQFGNYEKIRKEEADQDKRNRVKKMKEAKKGNTEDLFNVSSAYRIFSRAACNFAFPNPPGRPMPDKDAVETVEADIIGQESKGVQLRTQKVASLPDEFGEAEIDALSPDSVPAMNEFVTEDDVEERMKTYKEPTDYKNRIKAALKFLEYDPSRPEEEHFLNKEKLAIYSPKFAKILENLQDRENRGLHLLYSQFRTIEGIGILKLVLEANGFAEFKIKKNDSNDTWAIVENIDNVGKPHFVLYTGTETPEEREIIRNIYNSHWDMVPASITAKLRETSSNNFYGEIIQVLMITASGAEGINLKNTRFVHIVEPYWHMVRIDQVIGRARRICSHQDLPEEFRTVKVFLYLSVFSEQQKTNKKNIEMMNRDVSRLESKPITTDESLLESAFIKNNINKQLLDAVKETAIDCSLYNPTNKDENLVCYGFGKVDSNAFASYPTLQQDLSERQEMNIKKSKLKLKASRPINGVVYAIDTNTLDAYDMNSYNQALAGTGELILVGKIIKSGKGYEIKLL